MRAYLNRIDGIDDAIITMFLSKRNMTREKELQIRREVMACSQTGEKALECKTSAIGAIYNPSDALKENMDKLFKWGRMHITLLRFIDLSFSIYGMHRAGQDDIDAHSYRMNNRVIRSSTRLADFKGGEMSEFYQGKIVPTDVALAALGIDMPDELSYNGKEYVKGVNGYIEKGFENNRDYKRGLYMLSIPSDFVFRINLTEFAHFYKMRKESGHANPEVKRAAEMMADQLEAATAGMVTRQLLEEIQN